jgi:hypothetical protein
LKACAQVLKHAVFAPFFGLLISLLELGRVVDHALNLGVGQPAGCERTPQVGGGGGGSWVA